MLDLVDTNLIIRYLTNDDPKKAEEVEELFSRSNSIMILDAVVAEVIWVLTSKRYNQSKFSVIDSLRIILSTDQVIANKELLRSALDIWEKSKLDYIDAYLVANQRHLRDAILYTYDEEIIKVNKTGSKKP